MQPLEQEKQQQHLSPLPIPKIFFCISRLSPPRKYQLPIRTSQNCTNQQPPQRDGVVPDPVWVGSKCLLAFSRVPVTPGTPLIFSLCCPLNDPGRAAHSFFKIGRLFSLSLFSSSSLARLRPLILLVMSDNVHSDPGPVFPCSVCARNVTWRGK